MKQVRPLGVKKKEKQKYEAEPMVILPSIPPESVAQYSINLPSANQDKKLDEMDMLRHITEHLNEIVYTMEHVYVKDKEAEEEEETEEEESPSKDDYEDMATFLMCCSQLRNQLETALREEKLILESLLQWFEKEVHEMEELGEEQLIPDWQVPLADKNITDNISKLMDRIQRLEELKGRVQELPKLIQFSVPKQERRKPPSPVTPVQKDPRHIVEELALKHGTEDVINMAQVFQEDMGPQTIETMTNRMLEIVKVFERQTNKLHRVANEQEVLEGKLQKIQQEYRKLAEEKEIMEDELQKMKASETPAVPDTRKKVLAKLEKAKAEEKPQPTEKVQRTPLILSRQKESEQQMKMKEDLAKAQANVQALEKEKKMLEEMLRNALEEAGKAKVQLAEIPPNIPDWQFPYTAIGEDDKDLSKQSKKATKSKGKREDIQASASGTLQRLQRADTGKASEIVPGKSHDISTESQAKDTKHKKKGPVILDTEKGLSEGAPASGSVSPRTEKKAEEPKKKAKAETASKSKDSAEMKRQRSVPKGAGKETPGSPVSVPSPLPPIQVKQQLPDLKEETLPVTPGKSPEEILLPDSRRRKTEITISPQKDESLSIAEKKPSPLLPESEVQDLLSLPSAKHEEITEESELRPSLVSGMTPTPESIKTMERKTTFTPKVAQAAVGKERAPIPFTTEDRKASTVERHLPKVLVDSLELQEDEIKDAINERMLQLADHLTELKGIPEAETVANLLLAPGKGMEELSDRQKLQLLNQLITPGELQEAQILVEGEVADKTKEEEREKKKSLLANVATTLQLLQQTESPEVGQSEKEINEMADMRRILLANLESNLMDLQQAQVPGPSQQDVDREINQLSERRSQLLESLDLNMKNLQQAQALAATEPSEMNENKVKELLQQRELIAANLETNQQDLQSAKALEATLAEKDKNERKINQLSEKRSQLLASLDLNMKNLQQAQALAATEPSEVNENKVKELLKQRELIVANLEENLQDLQSAKALEATLAEKDKNERKINQLTEERKKLLANLDLNMKNLQQAQALAATEPSEMNENKVKELLQQRELIVAKLEANLQELRSAKALEDTLAEKDKNERKINQLSEKRSQLLASLDLNMKNLQQAQALAATEPSEVNENKVKELLQQRELIAANLETNQQDLQSAKTLEATLAEKDKNEQKINQLSEKRSQLLASLDLNMKNLQQAQALAATDPSELNENKVKELLQQRELVVTKLEANLQDLQSAKALEATLAEKDKHERKLNQLSEERKKLLANLDVNLKNLQQAQALAATEPSEMNENKVKELLKQRELIVAKLEANLQDLQSAKALEATLAEKDKNERKINQLSEERKKLLANLDVNMKNLQQAQALAATEPSEMNENKVKELLQQRELIVAKLEANLQDLQSAKALEAILAEKDKNETKLNQLSEKRKKLLANLDVNMKNLQQAQALAATEPSEMNENKVKELLQQRELIVAKLEANLQDLRSAKALEDTLAEKDKNDQEINQLSEKRSQLLASLDLNMKNLQKAQALAATEPSEMNENKVKELLKQRELIAANLETNLQDLQSAKALEATFAEKDMNEKKINELSKKRSSLLAGLESNLKELQEAQALEAIQPGSVPADKIKELTEQRKLLTANLETNQQALQRAQAYTLGFEEESRLPEMKLHVLSERKRVLQEKLDSNRKDLEQLQTLASLQPDSETEHKLQELTEQGRILNAELDTIVQDMQEIRHHASERGEVLRPSERELHELSEKKQLLLKNLESNRKELHEAQELAATQPGSVSAHKLQELAEQRKRLTAGLEATEQNICETDYRALERAATVKPPEIELYELIEKKDVLLKNLESNWKELQEAQELAATQPGSVTEHKLQELMEQRRHLNAEVAETVHNIQETQRLMSEGKVFVRPSIRELYELSEKKQLLLENLESNWKELQEFQALAATQPGSVNEHKLQELAERREQLTADLEATVHNIQIAQQRASKSPVILRPAERELYELSEKKQLLLENLESNWKELQEAEALAAANPGSIDEHKLQELAKQRQRLTMDLQATMEDIQKAQRRDLERPISVRPVVRELYELSEKKQLLLANLESNEKELKEAQALAATQPDSLSEKRLQELAEQRRNLTAELDATVNNIQKAQAHVSESIAIIHPADRDLYELSEKKQTLLESLKELQEAQAVAATQAGGVSEDKLRELALQRRRLTVDLEATLRGIEKVQSRPTAILASPSERELYELSEKKQFLLEKLESNRKELQAAQGLATLQPGSISESKLQQLSAQRRRLTLDAEATAHAIQELQRKASEKALIELSEQKLHDLSAKKQLLLENVESNLKDLQEAYAAAATQPGDISDKIIQVLNEQTKVLNANLATVVQDTRELKVRVSQLGGMKIPIERDLKQLYQKKNMFLEYLETNLNDLQEAQICFGTKPNSSNEQRIHELTEQRTLLTTALEAIIQDIEDVQHVQGFALDKGQFVKSEERVLAELSHKKKLMLKNLASNLKDLKQAQAFAAGHPGSIADDKVKELIEQRMLLAATLEGVEQDMQTALGPISEEVLKPTEKELDDTTVKRKLDFENIELNMKELKDLQALVASQPDNISEQKMQELTEKRKLLTVNIEAFLQDIKEMESNLELVVLTSPDVRKINDLILLSKLESKLNELEHKDVLSDSQLDRLKRKVRKLKKQKKGLIDRWEIPLQDELLAAAKLEEYGLDQQEIREFFERRRSLFSYVQSSIRDLKQKGIIQRGSLSDKELYGLSEDRHGLDKYLVAVPVQLLESERAAISTEQRAKQKALAAKLEANIKDFREQIKIKAAQIPTTKTEPLDQQTVKSVTSGLQVQITKVPGIKKIKPEHITMTGRPVGFETDISSFLTQQDKILKKEIEQALKRQLLQRSPSGKTSFPGVPTTEASVHRVPDHILQQMIDYRKGQLSSRKAHLQQALLFAKYQLQQANLLAAAKERETTSTDSQAPGITRFHEYSLQPRRPTWEGGMLPQKDYSHKLSMLRRRYMLPEVKGLSGGPSVPIQGPTSLEKEARTIAICGKGCSALKSKHELFPAIAKEPLRHA